MEPRWLTLRGSSRLASAGLKPAKAASAGTRSSLLTGGRQIGATSGLFLLKREQVQEIPSSFDRSHEERQRGEAWGGNTQQPGVRRSTRFSGARSYDANTKPRFVIGGKLVIESLDFLHCEQCESKDHRKHQNMECPVQNCSEPTRKNATPILLQFSCPSRRTQGLRWDARRDPSGLVANCSPAWRRADTFIPAWNIAPCA